MANPISWFKKIFSRKPTPLQEALIPARPKAITSGAEYGFPAGGDGSKWRFGLSATGASPIYSHSYIRQNARSAMHDSLQAKALVDRYADTVVAYGLKLECSPKIELLGITQEEAEEWSRKVETLFDLWARSKKCSRDECMNFYQLQRLAEVFQQRDNDYFVRFFYSPRKELLNPLQLQFIDPNQIRGYGYTSSYGFQSWDDGIERDAAGKEVAYKVWIRDDNDKFVEVKIQAYGPKSKRQFFIHGYQPEFAGQGRGFSRLSHALQEFENITDFNLSHIKKAIMQSALAMAVTPSKDNDASNPFADMSSRYGGAGPATDVLQPEVTGDAADILENLVSYENLPEATFNTPGAIGVFNLRKGEKLDFMKQNAPSEHYADFVNAFVSYLSASMSMPIEVLLMKFGQNYSASRGALLLFWQVAIIWRDELAADFLNPVYKNWLAGEIAAGRIQAPGWLDPRIQEAWLHCNWLGAPMPNIDPMRTAKADKEYIEMGAQTLDAVARKHNGSDATSNRAKLTREFGELPTPPWSKQSSSGGAGSIDEDNS
jgi:lambda family phage portal protein